MGRERHREGREIWDRFRAHPAWLKLVISGTNKLGGVSGVGALSAPTTRSSTPSGPPMRGTRCASRSAAGGRAHRRARAARARRAWARSPPRRRGHRGRGRASSRSKRPSPTSRPTTRRRGQRRRRPRSSTPRISKLDGSPEHVEAPYALLCGPGCGPRACGSPPSSRPGTSTAPVRGARARSAGADPHDGRLNPERAQIGNALRWVRGQHDRRHDADLRARSKDEDRDLVRRANEVTPRQQFNRVTRLASRRYRPPPMHLPAFCIATVMLSTAPDRLLHEPGPVLCIVACHALHHPLHVLRGPQLMLCMSCIMFCVAARHVLHVLQAPRLIFCIARFMFCAPLVSSSASLVSCSAQPGDHVLHHVLRTPRFMFCMTPHPLNSPEVWSLLLCVGPPRAVRVRPGDDRRHPPAPRLMGRCFTGAVSSTALT